MKNTVFLHIDMDCFYAAVETRDKPTLKGTPVIVGGESGRSVVSACNYEARKFGIHSAMPSARAKRLCPQAVFLPVNMEKYIEVSDKVMDILGCFTDRIEQISVDEAFMDISDTEQLFGPPLTLGATIKKTILKELKLSSSVGIAPNKFLSKLASEYRKPDGLFQIHPESVLDFLACLPVGKLWGVGQQTEKALFKLGLHRVADIRRYPLSVLSDKLGETHARHLKALSLGQDDRSLETVRETLSMSRETTFEQDVTDREILRKALLHQTDSVTRRLRREGMFCKTVTLIYRNTDFTKHTRRTTLHRPTDSTSLIHEALETLFRKEDFLDKPVRLIGMGVSGLQQERPEEAQQELFATVEKQKKDTGKILDKVIEKFGKGTLKRASLLSSAVVSGIAQ